MANKQGDCILLLASVRWAMDQWVDQQTLQAVLSGPTCMRFHDSVFIKLIEQAPHYHMEY